MYVVYTGSMNHFRCDSMADVINKLEEGSYQTAEVFKQKEDGTLERVYEYRK